MSITFSRLYFVSKSDLKIYLILKSSVNTGAGYLVNINDVAGPFSGIVFGISNTIGTIPGMVGPYITSVITAKVSLVN